MTARLRRTAAAGAAAAALAGAAVAAAAVAPAATTGPPAPTGSPAGIALARRVVAAYRHVPGMEIDGTVTLDGAPVQLRLRARLVGGLIRSALLEFRAGGRRVQSVANATGMYVVPPGRSCWNRIAGPRDRDLRNLLEGPAIGVAGSRFQAPVRKGALLALHLVERDPDGTRHPRIYRIDPATFTIVSTTDIRLGESATVRALRTAPRVPAPRPVCGPAGPVV